MPSVCARRCVCEFPVDARLPRLPPVGVIGQRMCVTVPSCLPVMPAHTHLVLYGKKEHLNKLMLHIRPETLPENGLLGVSTPSFTSGHSSPQRSFFSPGESSWRSEPFVFSVTKIGCSAAHPHARVFDWVGVCHLFLGDRKCTAVRTQVPCLF